MYFKIYFTLLWTKLKTLIPNKHKESAEERRARLDKNNEKARAKSRTETEQKKKVLFDVPDSELRSTSLLKKSRDRN